jgi:hypothetical protein
VPQITFEYGSGVTADERKSVDLAVRMDVVTKALDLGEHDKITGPHIEDDFRSIWSPSGHDDRLIDGTIYLVPRPLNVMQQYEAACLSAVHSLGFEGHWRARPATDWNPSQESQ